MHRLKIPLPSLVLFFSLWEGDREETTLLSPLTPLSTQNKVSHHVNSATSTLSYCALFKLKRKKKTNVFKNKHLIWLAALAKLDIPGRACTTWDQEASGSDVGVPPHLHWAILRDKLIIERWAGMSCPWGNVCVSCYRRAETHWPVCLSISFS